MLYSDATSKTAVYLENDFLIFKPVSVLSKPPYLRDPPECTRI